MPHSVCSTFIQVLRRVAPTMCALTFVAGSASASSVTFSGQDLNAGPGMAHPNSTLAAASFDAAAAGLGTVSLIDFESAAVGTYSSLVVAPGVTMSGQNYSGANQSILNAPNFPVAPALDGFNTTAGGAKYAEVLGGFVVFNFATPTQFFGAYLTGVQTSFYQDTFSFSDGTTQTINVPGTGTSSSVGALDFVGFTDAGKSITSVKITTGNANSSDYIGIDDVRYQGPSVAATPEPSSLILLGTGLLGMIGAVRRRF